jgi:tetratricopeptide (TPR) repeat protein
MLSPEKRAPNTGNPRKRSAREALMKLHPLIGAVALTLGLAGSAGAAVTVMGDTSAGLCSDAAFHERADQSSMAYCTAALTDDSLDRRDLAGTYINRGVLWMVRRDYAAARTDFQHAIDIDPALGEAWVNRGAVAIVDKQFQTGIDDISKGLTLGTEEPAKAYYNRAVAYEGIDDEKSAYLDYQQALVLSPGWDLPKQELLRFTVTRR